METTIETPSVRRPIVISEDRWLSHGTPSRPLLGLPLARLIPQDIHSLLDYAGAVGVAATSFLARSKRARAAGLALGATT